MKLLWNDKDGGPESRVWMWGLESKRFGSVLLMRFNRGTRDAYHSHAFNAVSWLLSGALKEVHSAGHIDWHFPSIRPIKTPRDTCHRVAGLYDRNWVLSFRGPWVNSWVELLPHRDRPLVLTHGRKVLETA